MSEHMQGVIILNLSGLYQVLTEGGDVYRCRARGIFRKNKITLSAGDFVTFQVLQKDEGIIEEILPRRNSFIRPNVSNVDMILYVISTKFPEPDPFLIDKMTVLAQLKNVEIVLIVNKLDLDAEHLSDSIIDLYRSLGFKVISCTATEMNQSEEILKLTRGKTVVLTGNTGVGKSTIINTLGFEANAKVSEISEKLGRGRHTTREVTFYQRLDGGLFGDTPGFGNVDITLEQELNAENLANFFVEFKPWISQCRFADCTHTGESGCMLYDKVQAGEIPKSRYNSYQLMFSALKQRDEQLYNGKKW